MDTIKVFTPEMVRNLKKERIPSDMIDSVNELLVENYKIRRGMAIISQEEILDRYIEKQITGSVPNEDRVEDIRAKVFENSWLDIESIYENAGWEVKYSKEPYNGTISASFTFVG